MDEKLEKFPISDDIGRTLGFLHQKDTVFEITAIGVTKNKSDIWKEKWTKEGSLVTGYFSDLNSATIAANRLDEEACPTGTFVTLNSCKESLLARANNRIDINVNRTSDNEVDSYSNLLIDIDPKRPSGISSTDEEHSFALEVAKKIKHFLQSDFCFPEPLFADSGNGAHLVFKIDLHNNQESQDTVKKCLQALSEKFSDDKVEIDTSVFNPGRLTKVYGTLTRKGDSIPKRPHRRSRIISVPESLSIVHDEFLKKLAATAICKVSNNNSIKNTNDYSSEHNLDIKSYLEHYNKKTKEIKSHGDSTLFVLQECVFNPSHDRGEASIVQHAVGMLSYQCFHNGCEGKTWKEAKEKISGDDSLRPFMKETINTPTKDIDSILHGIENIQVKTNQVQSASELMMKEMPPVKWVVQDLIPTGLTILAGKPKLGKSMLALNLAINVSAGHPLFNKYPSKQGTVLYLALEDSENRLHGRLSKMTEKRDALDKLLISYQWDGMDKNGIKALMEKIQEYEDMRLVIIDTLAKFRGASNNKELYQRDYDTISKLKYVADNFGIGILAVHHLRKASAEDPFDEISGTTGLSGAADTNIILRKNFRGHTNAEMLITGRDVEEKNLALNFQSETLTWLLLGNSKEFSCTLNEQLILEYIKSLGKPLSSKEIQDELVKEGINNNTVRSTLSRMIKKELLSEVKGRYSTTIVSNNNVQMLQQLQQRNQCNRCNSATDMDSVAVATDNNSCNKASSTISTSNKLCCVVAVDAEEFNKRATDIIDDNNDSTTETFEYGPTDEKSLSELITL